MGGIFSFSGSGLGVSSNLQSFQQFCQQQFAYAQHRQQALLMELEQPDETEVQSGYWQASEEIYNDPVRGGCPGLWRADDAATRAGAVAQREALRHTNAKRACASLVVGLVEAFTPPFPDEGVKVGEVIGYRAWRKSDDGKLNPIGTGSIFGTWDRYGVNRIANEIPTGKNSSGFLVLQVAMGDGQVSA